MKQILFIAVASLCLVLSGCSDKRDKCEEYAPADVTVSWTDYNTVEQVTEYFSCHSGTLKSHQGDTIRICGHCTTSIDDMLFEEFMYLGETPRKDGERVIVNLHYIENCQEVLREAMAGGNTKVYVTGRVSEGYLRDEGGLGCCGYCLDVIAIKISRDAI